MSNAYPKNLIDHIIKEKNFKSRMNDIYTFQNENCETIFSFLFHIHCSKGFDRMYKDFCIKVAYKTSQIKKDCLGNQKTSKLRASTTPKYITYIERTAKKNNMTKVDEL